MVGSVTTVPACDLQDVEEPHGLYPFSICSESGTHSGFVKQRQAASFHTGWRPHGPVQRPVRVKVPHLGTCVAGLRAGRVGPSRLLLHRVRSGRRRDVDGRVRTCEAQLSGQDGAAAPGPQDGLPLVGRVEAAVDSARLGWTAPGKRRLVPVVQQSSSAHSWFPVFTLSSRVESLLWELSCVLQNI